MSRSSPVSATSHHASEVFLFYRNKELHHIHRDRKVFEQWMENSTWLYPPDRCEIVRYVPAGHAQTPAEPHEATYLRGWNEGIERAAEVAQSWFGNNIGKLSFGPSPQDAIAAAIRALADTSVLGNSK